MAVAEPGSASSKACAASAAAAKSPLASAACARSSVACTCAWRASSKPGGTFCRCSAAQALAGERLGKILDGAGQIVELAAQKAALRAQSARSLCRCRRCGRLRPAPRACARRAPRHRHARCPTAAALSAAAAGFCSAASCASAGDPSRQQKAIVASASRIGEAAFAHRDHAAAFAGGARRAELHRIGMRGLVPDQRLAGDAVGEVDVGRAHHGEKIHEIRHDQPRRRHQAVPPVVDHGGEDHPVRNAPDEEEHD